MSTKVFSAESALSILQHAPDYRFLADCCLRKVKPVADNTILIRLHLSYSDGTLDWESAQEANDFYEICHSRAIGYDEDDDDKPSLYRTFRTFRFPTSTLIVVETQHREEDDL